MDEDTIVALGGYCEELMMNDFFNVLVQQYDLHCYDHLMGTAPHETKKRESIYAERTGLHNFLGHLKAVIEQKDKVLKINSELSNPDAHIEDVD